MNQYQRLVLPIDPSFANSKQGLPNLNSRSFTRRPLSFTKKYNSPPFFPQDKLRPYLAPHSLRPGKWNPLTIIFCTKWNDHSIDSRRIYKQTYIKALYFNPSSKYVPWAIKNQPSVLTHFYIMTRGNIALGTLEIIILLLFLLFG